MGSALGPDLHPDARPPRPVRVLVALCSLLVLGAVLWGAWAQRSYAILPAHVDPERVAYPVDVAGHAATSPVELAQLLLLERAGDTVDLGPPYGRQVLRPEVEGARFWVTLCNALLFWAVAALVLAPRVGRRGVGDLTLCFLLTGLAVAISGPARPDRGLGFALPSLYLIALAFMPPLFWRFSLAFPRRMPFLVRHGRFTWLALAAAAVVAAWNIQAYHAWFEEPGVARLAALKWPTHLLEGLMVLGMLTGIVTLFRNGRGAELAREKRQAKWILWGIAIGATPFVFLRILPRLALGTESPVDPAVDRLVEMTVPAAITVAVVRDRFLDVDVIIRRSLIYTALALGAVGIVFLTVLLAGRWSGLDERLVWALAAALPAATFLPARRAVGRAVDRTFFRIRYGHDQALAALQRALAPAAGRPEIGERLCAFLEEVLQPRTRAVAVREDGDWVVCGNVDGVRVRRALEALGPLTPEWGVAVARREATALPELERDALPPAVEAAGARVLQPIARNGQVHGLLLLGEKKSGRRYVEEDLRLLADSARQAGRALERVGLVQRVAEEALARRHLADLARQKADFFARLAHDLRTPLTAIRWSVRNLSEGLAGPVSERQGEYLTSVGAAAGQLGRLVDNLVDLSRLDLGAPVRAPEPIDLPAVVAEAVSALRVIADERGARIEIRAPEDLPRAGGRPEAAFQIVINLLDNALKFAPPGTPVEVDLRRDGTEAVALTVRDHGPGLPPGEAERLFTLFERGPESPQGETKGFGIGLHIVRSWTESLGGSVTADNHPEGGARFVCRLPAWQLEEEERP